MTVPPGLQFERAEWSDRAACVGITPLFFPERGALTREAKAVCAACPVRQPCLDLALANKEQHGIWGGLSTRERNKLRRPGIPKRPAQTVEHCAGGHPWDDYYTTLDGYRKCRYCVRAATARHRRARGIPELGTSADNVTQIRRPA